MLSEIPVDYPGGWPALLSGTSLAGEPTQSISFAQFLALYDQPASLPQALRDLNLEEISFLDGTPLAAASPAAFLIGATPLVDIRFGPTETWCDRLAADTAVTVTAPPTAPHSASAGRRH